ncbi:MAG: ACP S-malonyltransferase [SAR202 cluster bacterium]|nr:ACP S-malonyltransferase [SAR202 cluster bacterium]
MADSNQSPVAGSPAGRVIGNDIAFIFPGQGSQAVGMGRDLAAESRAARQVFDEVDEALKRPLSKIMFEGPEADLVQTENAQPAIMAVSLAAHAAMAEVLGRKPVPGMVAGHSLGEYSALAIAGVLSVTDTARLVVARGRLMQEACHLRPGGMAALIGIEEAAAEDICLQTGTYISNINSADQIIIAGDHDSLARAVQLAAARGARKAIPLSVGGAFHSGLMEPAQDGLNEMIESTPFDDPSIPIVGNCDALPLRTAGEVRAELRKQLMTCVQWKRSINYMVGSGVKRFVEIGPGRVLTGLVKRIDATAELLNVNSMAAARGLTA